MTVVYRPELGATPAERMRSELRMQHERELVELGRVAAAGGLAIHAIAIGSSAASSAQSAPAAYRLVDAEGEVVGPELDLDSLRSALAAAPVREPLNINLAAEAIYCGLWMWDQVAPGEFCSWRPILEGLDRLGLVDPVVINWACEYVEVERRRSGRGERWRLKR